MEKIAGALGWIIGFPLGVFWYMMCLEWVTPTFPKQSMIGWYILLAGLLALGTLFAFIGLICLIVYIIGKIF